ncbi:MFS transporter [Catellatospora citrea]|uniref:MFS transporter n=1 Tax=Catellatospora citrea TaxID=53366 RepID=UPI0033FDF56D
MILSEQETPRAVSLWRDGDFVRLWAARVVSVAGSAVTAVALPALVYARTQSPVLTSLLAAASAAPYLVFGLLAGAMADRTDRRRLMVWTDLARGALLATVPLVALVAEPAWWHLLAVAWLVASVGVWFDAASFGALPTLVRADQLVEANSRVWSASTAAQIAMPALAGLMIASIGAGASIAVDAVSFAVAAALVYAIGRPLNLPRDAAERSRRSLLSDVREGLRFLFTEPTIRLFTALGVSSAFSGGALIGLLVVYADRRFGVGQSDSRLGLMFAAGGVGALLATLLLPRLSRRFAPQPLTLVGMAAGAVVLVGLAFAPSWPAGVALLAAWGVASMFVIVNGISVRQALTPEHLQGRVNVVGRMLTFGVGQPLGAVAAGLLAERLSVTATLLLCTIPLFVALAPGVVGARRQASADVRTAAA